MVRGMPMASRNLERDCQRCLWMKLKMGAIGRVSFLIPAVCGRVVYISLMQGVTSRIGRIYVAH